MYKAIDFLGIEVSAITKPEIVDKILEFALTGKQKMITYLNAHCVNVSFVDSEYRRILGTADLVYAGGMGVVWASRLFGSGLPERVNILDFFDLLIDRLIAQNISVYLLGGEKNVVKKAAAVLKGHGLQISGSRHGFFNAEEEKAIIAEINSLRPHILMIGMGVPKQEKWIYNHLSRMDVNLCWEVGAAFDWLSGQRKRAPRWMIKCGLEWLHRFSQEPKRLRRRYLIGNVIFIHRVLKWKVKILFH